jgi:hypothetical protein
VTAQLAFGLRPMLAVAPFRAAGLEPEPVSPGHNFVMARRRNVGFATRVDRVGFIGIDARRNAQEVKLDYAVRLDASAHPR